MVKKVKEFVQEHKKELVIGIGVVFAVGVCVVCKKSIHLPNSTGSCPKVGNKIRDIKVPDGFSVGRITDLFEHGDEIVSIAQGITVNDLGKFGEELVRCGVVADGAEAAITAEFLKNV